MKIPEGTTVLPSSDLIKDAQQLVNGLILEHGVHIEVVLKTVKEDFTFAGVTATTYRVTEIQFKTYDNVFDNLKELRKALENKAFM